MTVEAMRSQAWRALQAHHDEIAAWVKDDITGVKIADLLTRRGVEIPAGAVQRYIAEVLGRRRPA